MGDRKYYFLACSLSGPGLRWVGLSQFVLVEWGNIVHFVVEAQAAQVGSLFGCIDLEAAGMREVVNLGHILELVE